MYFLNEERNDYHLSIMGKVNPFENLFPTSDSLV